MRLVDRYLARQLVLPFTVGLVTFVAIMLAEVAWRISGLILGAGVSAGMLARFFLLSAPRAAVWSAPVGALVGVSMAMTSLERHGEITAMRGAGASLPRLQAPWIVIAGLVTAAALVMTEWVVPASTTAAQDVFSRITYQAPIAHQAYDQHFRSPDGRLFYVRELDTGSDSLKGVTIWRPGPDGHIQSITVARQAKVEGRKWILLDGYTRRFDDQGQPVGGPERFTQRPVELWAAIHEYYADKRTPYEMSITELRDLAQVLAAGGKDVHQLRVHLEFKYSIPCAALVLALVAAPLAHRYARYGSFAGLLIAIVVLFLYNGVRSWTLALGLAGTLTPIVAGWLPNALFGALGVVLMARQR